MSDGKTEALVSVVGALVFVIVLFFVTLSQRDTALKERDSLQKKVQTYQDFIKENRLGDWKVTPDHKSAKFVLEDSKEK